MSRKKFKAGLESLFGDTSSEDIFQDESLLLIDTDANEKTPITKPKRRSVGKNFTSDLDTLFKDALKETVVEQVQKLRDPKPLNTARLKKRGSKPLVGLDTLIRETIEVKSKNVGVSSIPTKRVTFSFEKTKFDKLKSIADKKKSYLRDVIDQIITDYISEFDNEREQF